MAPRPSLLPEDVDDLHSAGLKDLSPEELLSIGALQDLPDDYIQETEQLEDGSSVYEIGAPERPTSSNPQDFYANLASTLSEEALTSLSTHLLEAIDEDLNSRKEWLDSIDKVHQYLGFSIEDTTHTPFPNATTTFDTTLGTALIRFYATMRAEFFPQDGLVQIQTTDKSSINQHFNPNPSGDNIHPQQDALADRVKEFLNHYLTLEDKGYYADNYRALLYLGFYGSMVKKVYLDPVRQAPLSRFIVPKDFIVNNDCTELLESERLTHVLHLSKREILHHLKTGYYTNTELPYLKDGQVDPNLSTQDPSSNPASLDVENYTQRSLFDFYEIHTYLTLEDFVDPASQASSDSSDQELPKPYIVTLCRQSRKVVRIVRNWQEHDPTLTRINYFIHYTYLPGFGIYGLGLAHLLGTNALTLTKLLRQLVDAGSFKNLPGGLRSKGSFKNVPNDLMVGPGQFVAVDTGSVPLRDVFLPLPYSEPSMALRELRQEIMTQTKELAATSEMSIADRQPNAPMGTTLALLEVNQRIQSAVFESFYFSLGQELQAIYKMFQQTPQFQQHILQGQDDSQSFPTLDITPVADPSLDSKTQRMARAEALLHTARESPELYDLREVHKRFCEAMGIQDVEEILKPPESELPPCDPVTENANGMKGIPLKVYPWQNDDAHITVHAPFAEENPGIKAHIQDHQASKYLKEMQQKMGLELPPLEQLHDNPELENHIALMAAQATLVMPPETQASQKPITPQEAILAEVAQKKMETEARERIAQLKAETDVFKTQMGFETEKMKIDSNETIAELKSETELEKIQSHTSQGVSP